MNTSNNNQTSIKELAFLAEKLHDRLEEMNRPLIIEFAGTPKSGKTTCINAISKFFRRNHIPLHLITERASLSPISNKHHLFFNTWTGATSLTQMLEGLEKRSNIIMLDRGIFDSLVWMDFLQTWHAVRPDELKKIEDFFLLDAWTSRIDIVVALSTNPTVALAREFKDQITDLPGSIMNIQNLEGYNASLQKASEKYKDKFYIMPIDTTEKETIEGVTIIANQLLNAAYRLVDEEIAVVDREFVSSANFNAGVLKSANDISVFIEKLKSEIKWMKRREAEADLSLVQIIPVTSIYRGDEIMVAKIRGEKNGRLASHNSIWAGGHIRISDNEHAQHFFVGNVFHSCLSREVDEELHIRIRLNDVREIPNLIVWDTTDPRSAQHLGLMYQYQMSEKTPKEVLHLREFYESKSKSLFTHFRKLDQNLVRIPDWESWSISFLKHVHNIDVPVENKQGKLF